MPALRASQHLFSSVERGLFPQQGSGFQTVAATPDLIGTEDLQTLEEAAFYALSRERRAAGSRPVKETFFRLPSNRFACGRTVDLGTDALGREGNYLSHHLILSREDLLRAGANPFTILDATLLPGDQANLAPRELSPLDIEITYRPTLPQDFDGIPAGPLASLVKAAIDRGGKTILLVGDEDETRRLLRGIVSSIAIEERLGLTFSTYFYESQHLRPLFALTSVESRAEAPSQLQPFLVFDLNDCQIPQLPAGSAYAEWLEERLKAQDWRAVIEFNQLLDRLRGHQGRTDEPPFPASPGAYAPLWERAGTGVVPEVKGDARRVKTFLAQVSSPGPLADALLAAASPSELCGLKAEPEMAVECLTQLKSAAAGKQWSQWVKRWRGDPTLDLFLWAEPPWWQKWKR